MNKATITKMGLIEQHRYKSCLIVNELMRKIADKTMTGADPDKVKVFVVYSDLSFTQIDDLEEASQIELLASNYLETVVATDEEFKQWLIDKKCQQW